VARLSKRSISRAGVSRAEPDTSLSRTLTHIDGGGAARMVDVSPKPATERVAIAAGFVRMSAATLELVLSGNAKKGDVLGAARIAGIMAAKKTHELIPLCHPLAITKAEVEITPVAAAGADEVGLGKVGLVKVGLAVQATVKVTGPTGVEMEALTAVSVACLTVYDMIKAVERGVTIEAIHLVEKRGGKSGHYRAEPSAPPAGAMRRRPAAARRKA
jgi:cyclic pyranopterin phosphate synthase